MGGKQDYHAMHWRSVYGLAVLAGVRLRVEESALPDGSYRLGQTLYLLLNL